LPTLVSVRVAMERVIPGRAAREPGISGFPDAQLRI
jgi:hypothetical protein